MLTSNQASLFFTVAMLAVTTYFLFGSIPLLILRHDNPMDSKFIKSFYVTYFKIALTVTMGATIAHALANKFSMLMVALAVGCTTIMLRRKLISQMELQGSAIQGENYMAVPEFRKTHKSAIIINVVQLLSVLTGLISL